MTYEEAKEKFCNPKLTYGSPKTATKAMLRYLNSGIHHDCYGYYRCRFCKKYHLTTKNTYEKE